MPSLQMVRCRTFPAPCRKTGDSHQCFTADGQHFSEYRFHFRAVVEPSLKPYTVFGFQGISDLDRGGESGNRYQFFTADGQHFSEYRFHFRAVVEPSLKPYTVFGFQGASDLDRRG